MTPEVAAFTRLILFRPRPEFPLPREWRDRPWVPLGEMRPLLLAVSPVRDLADVWRWVAEPLPEAEARAVLAQFEGVEVRWGQPPLPPALQEQQQAPDRPRLLALVLPSATDNQVERIELIAADLGLLGALESRAAKRMLAMAATSALPERGWTTESRKLWSFSLSNM